MRWAAKEAVFKSIPGYPAVTIPWREVGLETPLGCGPRLRISNSHLSRLGLDFEVTLAQKGDAVMACVVAHRFKKGEL